jgi:hypothetical protein
VAPKKDWTRSPKPLRKLRGAIPHHSAIYVVDNRRVSCKRVVMNMENLFVETPTEVFCGHILSSTIRPATEADVKQAMDLHKTGNCTHTVVMDERGWLYDYRVCATCGKGLGLL